jgi:predicted TPR repeat methyltransferase
MTEKHTHHHHDHAAANAEHFSDRAQTYRTELSIELSKRCAALILNKYPFDSNKTELLDFACGPGLVAAELLSHVKRIVGADSAQGMVDVFNHDVSVEFII